MWLWRAYQRLSADRPWYGGMSAMIPAAIPWQVGRAWCIEHGYDEYQTAFFDACFCELDKVYLQHYQQKAVASSSKGSSKL